MEKRECSTLSKRNARTVFSSVVLQEGQAQDYSQLVRIASDCAKQKEGTCENISILEILFCPKLRLYVAVYKVPASSRRMRSQRRSEKESDSMT